MTTDTYVEILDFARRGVRGPQAPLKGQPFACAGLKNPLAPAALSAKRTINAVLKPSSGSSAGESALQGELRLGYGAKRGCVIADRFADGV